MKFKIVYFTRGLQKSISFFKINKKCVLIIRENNIEEKMPIKNNKQF